MTDGLKVFVLILIGVAAAIAVSSHDSANATPGRRHRPAPQRGTVWPDPGQPGPPS